MSFDDLPREEKQQVWSAIGATMTQYWSEVDLLLDEAIGVATDPRLIRELNVFKAAAAGAGVALGTEAAGLSLVLD